MKTFRFPALLLLSLLLSCPAVFCAAPTRVDDPVEGQKLAREIRGATPVEEAKINGVLRISRPGSEPREIPFESRVVIGSGKWSSVYAAKMPDGTTETLTVHHFADKPNEYEWRRGNSVQKFDGPAATNSFARSDFALMDLGMEFYHWPGQVLVYREMRKGRGSDVLQSSPGQANAYSRVLSWIDQESRAQGAPGVIMAEAYDRNGKLVKEFEVRGMKEVGGRWQVREMELRNRQTKTATRLQFHFDEK
jgi:hypothetical protein